MRIKQKFIQLTKKTYPNGTEFLLEDHLPDGYQKDEFGNYYLEVGENARTMFTCHLDTASMEIKDVTHVFDGKYIRTNGETILGADDKAGMCIILNMIEKKIPGLYYFFIGEEVGRLGSNDLSKLFITTEHGLDRVISFDRRGTDSIITHQSFGRCCSNEFAEELSKQLNKYGFNFNPDPTGSTTDSASFMDFIPECTNISVGYYNEHKTTEHQDIEFLEKLANACIKIDWESLPVKRDPNEVDDLYKSFNDSVYETFDEYLKANNRLEYTYGYYKQSKKEIVENYTFIVDKHGDKVKATISESWIEKEKHQIYKLLKYQGIEVNIIKWDGNDCYIQAEESNCLEFLGTRSGLIPMIPDLANIPMSELTLEKKKQVYVL